MELRFKLKKHGTLSSLKCGSTAFPSPQYIREICPKTVIKRTNKSPLKNQKQCTLLFIFQS